MRRRLGSALVAALLVVAVGGCTTEADEPAPTTPPPPPSESSASAAHLLVSRSRPGYRLRNEESITGVLTVDDHGCVVVERDGETALLWAPVGSSLTGSGSAVTAPTLDDDLELGDTVTFQGEWASTLAPVKAVRPEAWSTCATGDEATVAFVSY